MNQQEYLSQISNNVRPPKAPKSGLLSSPIFKIALIGVVAVIGIIIFGSIVGGNKKSAKDLFKASSDMDLPGYFIIKI